MHPEHSEALSPKSHFGIVSGFQRHAKVSWGGNPAVATQRRFIWYLPSREGAQYKVPSTIIFILGIQRGTPNFGKPMGEPRNGSAEKLLLHRFPESLKVSAQTPTLNPQP